MLYSWPLNYETLKVFQNYSKAINPENQKNFLIRKSIQKKANVILIYDLLLFQSIIKLLSLKSPLKMNAIIAKFYSDKTWVSPDAIVQLKKTAELPGIFYVAAMPDIHPGPGTPGGAAFISKNLIHPKLIGGDIGCGMQLCSTSIDIKTNIRQLAGKIGSIDNPFQGDFSEIKLHYRLENNNFLKSLGTIGGGNHFAELQVFTKIFDQKMIDLLDLNPKKAILLIHSGSRGYGQNVLNNFNAKFGAKPLEAHSQDGLEYLSNHDEAVRYAKANRELIAKRFGEKTGSVIKPLLDLCHNFIEKKQTSEGPIWIHRKGAAPSDSGLVVIPGSRSSFTYIVKPLGDGIANAFSLAHGAGRKISRSQSEDKFGRLSHEELQRPRDKKNGIDNYVICENKQLLRQEHGKAYKDINQVIGDLKDLGLIEVVAILKPVITYKTRSDSEDGDG